MSASQAGPSPFDFYLLDERLTDEERAIRDRLRAFCDAEVTPIINGYWERAEFPFELVPKIAGLGLAGDGDGYVLNGAKKWIGNATFADVVIIWARGEDGKVGGYLVEKGAEGFETELITGKTSLRAVWQAQITLNDVRVPGENRLPGCE